MRIAVTYDNGEVFQHFGHTESFRIYNVEDDKIVSSEVISSNGQGHGALANVLAGEEVDVLICGGIGGGAHQALTDNGIKICAGASGDADKAVESFLKGELDGKEQCLQLVSSSLPVALPNLGECFTSVLLSMPMNSWVIPGAPLFMSLLLPFLSVK